MMAIGDTLPANPVVMASGEAVTLRTWSGQPVVVYFYPKADTPGCTNEAKDFSALRAEFDKLGVAILGVSKDKPAKLAKFAEKYGLSVTLLSDADSDLCEAMGTWIEKSMYGRSYMGIARATFIADADGVIRHVWPAVKVKGHAQDVLERARDLFGTA